MQYNILNFFKLGLRGKLLLATLTLLLLPIASYFYLHNLEIYLNNKQIQMQLETTQIMASLFDASEALSRSNQHHNGQSSIYIYPLKNTPVVDGYADDWRAMHIQPQQFFSQSGVTHDKEKFELFCGIRENRLYFFVAVEDTTSRYKLPIYDKQYDRVKLALWDSESSLVHEFFIASEAPGWIKAESVLTADSHIAAQIKGEWQETEKGYQIEFSLPSHLIGKYMSITVYDDGVSFSSNNIKLSGQKKYNPLIMESSILNQKLAKIKQKVSESQARLYILNRHSEILARAGDLKTTSLVFREADSFITHLKNLYQALAGMDIKNQRYYARLSKLTGPEIEKALGVGRRMAESASAWLMENNSKTLILSTAAPIFDETGEVLGALVLEKTNADILALQDQTFEEILLISVILFIGNSGILLLYSGSMIKRIRQLQKAMEQALTQEGKLNPLFPSCYSNDEIGELSRGFSTLMKRLNQYTGYLESLAGKLSHELRTPLSVITSSLENMQFQGVEQKNQVFMKRAQDGCQRLSLILTRMGEAGRLEHALQSSEKQVVEMNHFIRSYIDAIQGINTEIEFKLLLRHKYNTCLIAPELIAQLLDKLVDNAISFHTPQSAIIVSVERSQNWFLVDIFNTGPWIEADQHDSIFDSMVSYRKSLKVSNKDPKNRPLNLGLGLHIARLISNYHQGKLNFFNRQADKKLAREKGVSFVLSLKIIR